MSRRSTRTQKLWKVESSGLASEVWPRIFSTRSAISLAALLVKVTARMESAGDAALFDEVGDAVGDDARLARACAGEQQHGAVDGLDAFALLRIHVVEKAGHGGRDSSFYVNWLGGGLRITCAEVVEIRWSGG